MTSPSLLCVRTGLKSRATGERASRAGVHSAFQAARRGPGRVGLGFCSSVSAAKMWVSTDRVVGTAGLFPESLGLTKRRPWLFISSCLREQERLSGLCVSFMPWTG